MLLRMTRRLHEALSSRVLTRGELRWGGLGGVALAGMSVRECVSYGKHTLIRLDSQLTVHTHLKMDGTWRISPTSVPPKLLPDPQIRVVLAGADWTAVSRLTGEVHVVPTREEELLLGHLGPDLLAGETGAATARAPDFAGIAQAAQGACGGRTIGAILLDQRIAAGIGTIYLAESLWIAGVHPRAPASGCDLDVLERIYRTAAALMARSADARRLTATGDLRPGWRTHVHGRNRLPCRRCGGFVARVEVGDEPFTRPAFYCPVCQPAP